MTFPCAASCKLDFLRFIHGVTAGGSPLSLSTNYHIIYASVAFTTLLHCHAMLMKR